MDRGSFPEYFQTFPSLLGAKLIEVEQFEIIGEKKELCRKTRDEQSCGSSSKVYCAYIHVNLGCIVCIGESNKNCVV